MEVLFHVDKIIISTVMCNLFVSHYCLLAEAWLVIQSAIPVHTGSEVDPYQWQTGGFL